MNKYDFTLSYNSLFSIFKQLQRKTQETLFIWQLNSMNITSYAYNRKRRKWNYLMIRVNNKWAVYYVVMLSWYFNKVVCVFKYMEIIIKIKLVIFWISYCVGIKGSVRLNSGWLTKKVQNENVPLYFGIILALSPVTYSVWYITSDVTHT